MLYDKIIEKKKVLICSEMFSLAVTARGRKEGMLHHPKHPNFPRPWVTLLFFIGRHEKNHKV